MLQLPLLPVALLASLAAAQTTTFSAPASASTSACGAQPVLEQCLGSTELIAAACAATDYNCLCQKWTDVVVCFNVCPDDTRLAGLQNTKDSYCAYATTSAARVVSSGPASTATAAPTTASATGTQTMTSTGSTLSVASGSRSATASAAAGTATGESGAGRVALGAGGVLMGVAGFAGVFL
ncbi:hypothetical protein BUE80_DR010604 [Diplocarpon rosae]|nr:hypothetical protein BUE80_DR010604 [Diplocarpon rosae]